METAYGEQEPGINTNVVMHDGKVMGVEIRGFVGGNVSREEIGKLARDFEHSVGDVIEKLR